MRFIPLLALAFLVAAPARAEPLHDAVDAYALYQNDITALITLDVAANDLDAALALALRHDPDRVAQGWLAYGALAASQSPAFVAGVRSRIRAAGRAPVLRQLTRDATYARRRPPGAAEAINIILASNAADTTRMIAAGHRYSGFGEGMVESASDAVRRDTRSEQMRTLAGIARPLAPDLAPRLHPGVLGATPLTDPYAFGGVRFWDALARRTSALPGAAQWREQPSRADRINRMLTLAGLFIAEAGDTPRVRDMLRDGALTECLAMEQLELRQCASVSASANDDAHCIARHGLTEPAACFALAQAP